MTNEPPKSCYRERTNGVYFTRNGHEMDCTDSDCRGCKRCPEINHCSASRNCSWHVSEGELTCGRCLASARADLRWIVPLAALLMPAAISDGIDSEAANLAGPATDAEAWTWRKLAARNGTSWHVSLIEDDDEHHPSRVLGTWVLMLTDEYGHEMPHGASLAWCSAYLDRTLYRVAQDEVQDFPLLARELRKCRQHIEAVLHNDDRSERGAPCPECRDDGQGLIRLVREYPHHCENPDCTRLHYDTDAEDRWVCPRKPREHAWSQASYSAYLEERRGA